MPVLIYERVKVAQYLRYFKLYRRKLLFIGKVNVVGILLMGVIGHSYIMHTQYDSKLHQELLSILSTAGLDLDTYYVVDWFKKKNRLIIIVTKALGTAACFS